MPKKPKKRGLVLSGGGARGAYEAGVLHYIRTMLPPKIRGRSFDIHCGSSVGAINTCFIASTAHDPIFQGQETYRLWHAIREENLYRRDMGALMNFISKSSRGILLNLIRGPEQKSNHFNGFLNTDPLLPFIEKTIQWPMISKNIRSKIIQAISIVATNVLTGRMELFVEKDPSLEYTGEYVIRYTKVLPIHAMASAAIPIVFPTVVIDGTPYTDGGLRLNTPISPAIQLGADSILVIGLHYRRPITEVLPEHKPTGKPASLGQVLGRVMNSIFLDRVQYDIEQLERINRIIEWSEMLYGKSYRDDLNNMLRQKKIVGDVANRGLKKLNVLRISPSKDIGNLFMECYQRGKNSHFSSLEKFLVRFLDIDPTSGNDFLSYLSFMPEYLNTLIDLGFEDAKSHHDELIQFFED